MRIIGGIYKKKKLLSVPGLDTRPTADRLRETLFNILSFHVRDAVVLDLFAGTGAMGLEALSRGARSCVFIDNSRDALSVITKNCTACTKLTAQTAVHRWDVLKNLACIEKTDPPFTLVFIDPPYGKDMIPVALLNLSHAGCLDNEALVVAEHAAEDRIPPPPGYSVYDQRIYGKTAVTFYTFERDVSRSD